jgi:hypothetical protein
MIKLIDIMFGSGRMTQTSICRSDQAGHVAHMHDCSVTKRKSAGTRALRTRTNVSILLKSLGSDDMNFFAKSYYNLLWLSYFARKPTMAAGRGAAGGRCLINKHSKVDA